MGWFRVLVVLVACAAGVARGETHPIAGEQGLIAAMEGVGGVEASEVVEGSGIAGKQKGTRFTPKNKESVKKDNASRNHGTNHCENCGVETVPAQQHKKGVTPPANETQVDHVVPKSKGGKGVPENGQVLCRECNLEKGDKEQ
jgi:threonine dehydrogenase-like Zn-dependent dehydrogenase